MIQFLSVLLFLICTLSFGQKSEYRTFKMIIVSPDSVAITEELNTYVDSIESDYVKGYYKSIKQMEEFLKWDDNSEEVKKTKKKIEENLKIARQSEQEIKRFRYFETIPSYSRSVLEMYFNEYPPNSTFQVVRTKDLKSTDLKVIAETYKADYVVSYRDIHTDKLDNGLISMNLTTVLFASKESKILFERQTTGDMNSYGDMWTCSNPLSCLLITSEKSSTTQIYNTVSKRQKK
jgi:hypothetical protein